MNDSVCIDSQSSVRIFTIVFTQPMNNSVPLSRCVWGRAGACGVELVRVGLRIQCRKKIFLKLGRYF